MTQVAMLLLVAILVVVVHADQSEYEWNKVAVGDNIKGFAKQHVRTSKRGTTTDAIPCVQLPNHERPVGIAEGDIVMGDCVRNTKANEWELKKQRHLQSTVAGSPWPHGIVVWQHSPTNTLNTKAKDQVTMAVREWEENSVLRFVQHTTESAYINIIDATGCYSSVGRTGGVQNLGLHPLGYCGFGAAVHEYGHAIKMLHEQSRQDRDTYVTVNTDNVQESKLGNFAKGGTMMGDYDYGSIMHYGATAFANTNGAITIAKKTGKYNEWKAAYNTPIDIGNRNHLSVVDKGTVGDLYDKCFATTAATGAARWDYAKIDQAVDTYPNEVWSVCQASCVAPGKQRTVFCRDGSGACAGSDVCAGLTAPIKQDFTECVNAAPSQVCDFENGPCFLDPFSPDGQFAWTAAYDNGAGATTRGPTGDSSGLASKHWYYVMLSRSRPSGVTGVMASIPLKVLAPTEMTFKYWWYTAGGGGTHATLLVILSNCVTGESTTVMTIDDTTTTSMNSWQSASVTLPASESTVIKFKATVGTLDMDVAIDDVFLDAGATVTIHPVTGRTVVSGGTIEHGGLQQPDGKVNSAVAIGIASAVLVVLLGALIAFVYMRNKERLTAYHRTPNKMDVDVSDMAVDANPFGSGGSGGAMKLFSRSNTSNTTTTTTTTNNNNYNNYTTNNGRSGFAAARRNFTGGATVTAATAGGTSAYYGKPYRAPLPVPAPPAVLPADGWMQCTSEEGYPYWYNEHTEVSQWDSPYV